jgi:hypothetical protein
MMSLVAPICGTMRSQRPVAGTSAIWKSGQGFAPVHRYPPQPLTDLSGRKGGSPTNQLRRTSPLQCWRLCGVAGVLGLSKKLSVAGNGMQKRTGAGHVA